MAELELLDRDITGVKEAEGALRKSEHSLKKAQRVARVGSWEWHIPTNSLEWSDEMYHIFGIDKDSFTGHLADVIETVIHPDDRQAVEQANLAVINDKNAVPLEYRIIWPNGAIRVVWAEAGDIILDEEGSPIVLTGIVQDITARKRAEREREALIAELETKNAELERFTYTVSHDLKSPLITISVSLGFLEEDTRAGNYDESLKYVEQIKNATRTMESLLNDLLELSRIGRMVNPSQNVSLGELAHEVVAVIAGQIQERGVQVKIAPTLPSTYGDRLRLLEMMQNLIDNAVKFMGDQPDPVVEIGTLYEDGETICYVRDNGMGVDPRYHKKIFGFFERLDMKIQGTGVGLALVRRIVELHNGRIWIQSEGNGKGSTFYFVLPNSKVEETEPA